MVCSNQKGLQTSDISPRKLQGDECGGGHGEMGGREVRSVSTEADTERWVEGGAEASARRRKADRRVATGADTRRQAEVSARRDTGKTSGVRRTRQTGPSPTDSTTAPKHKLIREEQRKKEREKNGATTRMHIYKMRT